MHALFCNCVHLSVPITVTLSVHVCISVAFIEFLLHKGSNLFKVTVDYAVALQSKWSIGQISELFVRRMLHQNAVCKIHSLQHYKSQSLIYNLLEDAKRREAFLVCHIWSVIPYCEYQLRKSVVVDSSCLIYGVICIWKGKLTNFKVSLPEE